MNLLASLFSETRIERLGWVLIHFFWQGIVIALVLAVFLRLFTKASSHARYALAGIALLICAVAPMITWTMLAPQEAGLIPTTTPDAVSPLLSQDRIPTTTTRPSPRLETPIETGTTWQVALAQAMTVSLPYAVGLWFMGVVILSTRLTLGWVWMKRLCRSSIPATDRRSLEKLQGLLTRMQIGRPVQLLESALVEVPTLIGWLRPTILVPVALFTGMMPEELEAIFAHELAHVRRYDYVANLLQTAIETVLFYHPAVWWISRKLREERENCCDDIALEVMQDRLLYASALARLEEGRTTSLVLAATGGSLLQRTRRIVGVNNREASAWPLWFGIICTVFVVCLMRTKATELPLTPSLISASMSDAEAARKGIAAVVNGEPIYWSELPIWDNASPEPFLRRKFSGNVLKQKLAEAREREIEQAIDHELVIEDAKASGYQAPQQALDDRINFGIKGFGGSKEAFVENLERNGLSLEKFNQRNRDDLMYAYIFGIKVYTPTNLYVDKLSAGGLKPSQQLYTAESMKLENELLDSLRSKAVIQTFGNPKDAASGYLDTTNPETKAAESPNTPASVLQDDFVHVQVLAIDLPENEYQANRSEIDAAVHQGNFLTIQHFPEARVITRSTLGSARFGQGSGLISGPNNPSLVIDCTATRVRDKIKLTGNVTMNHNEWIDRPGQRRLCVGTSQGGFAMSGTFVPNQLKAISEEGAIEPVTAQNENNRKPYRLFLFFTAWPEEPVTASRTNLETTEEAEAKTASSGIKNTALSAPPVIDRASIIHKLQAIIFDQVDFEHEDITEVIQSLAKRSKELDPEHQGVLFILRLNSGINATGPSLGKSDPSFHREITLHQKNVSLAAIVGAVVDQSKLTYSLQDDAIYLNPPSVHADLLTVRTYLAPANFLSVTLPAPGEVTSPDGKTIEVTTRLTDLGFQFPAGASAILLPGSNKLVVRNTPQQLDLIAEYIERLQPELPATAPTSGDSSVDNSDSQVKSLQLSLDKPLPDKHEWAEKYEQGEASPLSPSPSPSRTMARASRDRPDHRPAP
jgi:beta-lactamase regulating signal transducer with metallopeptidase domain